MVVAAFAAPVPPAQPHRDSVLYLPTVLHSFLFYNLFSSSSSSSCAVAHGVLLSVHSVLPPSTFLLLLLLLLLLLPCSAPQGQAESGGMVLVAYAGPVRPAAALRDSVLCLPNDIYSLFVNQPSSSSSSSSSAVALGVHLSVPRVGSE